MREEAYLLAGRTSFYYMQYYFEATAGQPGAVECTLRSRQSVCGRGCVASPQSLSRSPDLVVASLKVVLEAWESRVPLDNHLQECQHVHEVRVVRIFEAPD